MKSTYRCNSYGSFFFQQLNRFASASLFSAQAFTEKSHDPEFIKAFFLDTPNSSVLYADINVTCPPSSDPLKVGILLSGREAPGIHNVVISLLQTLKSFHPDSVLLGFKKGFEGVIEGVYEEIVSGDVECYCNTGGSELILAGYRKVYSSEEYLQAVQMCEKLQLDGLVILGGKYSLINMTVLNSLFLKKQIPISIVGVPKTIDGDLKNCLLTVPLGFDTACKTCSEIIGNLARDSVSSGKYWHFIRLMGQAASHIVLECALQTRPDIAIIGEEISANNFSIHDVAELIVEKIIQKSLNGQHYGVILLPDGLLEHLKDMKDIIHALNENTDIISPEHMVVIEQLPEDIRLALLTSKDSFGNVNLSAIPVEEWLSSLIENILVKKEISLEHYKPFIHSLGYQARAAAPSVFDAEYGSALGVISALLIKHKKTGYLANVAQLHKPVEEWVLQGISLKEVLISKKTKDGFIPDIEPFFIDLNGSSFQKLKQDLIKTDPTVSYRYPGPIQFYGPHDISEAKLLSLQPECKQE